jgi:hypothetical protein
VGRRHRRWAPFYPLDAPISFFGPTRVFAKNTTDILKLAPTLTIELDILVRVRAARGNPDSIVAIIDTEWPREPPCPIDRTFNWFAEPWLDEANLFPDLTLRVKRNLAAHLSEIESDPEAALLIYRSWPFTSAENQTA